jgi:hypothetical protein
MDDGILFKKTAISDGLRIGFYDGKGEADKRRCMLEQDRRLASQERVRNQSGDRSSRLRL